MNYSIRATKRYRRDIKRLKKSGCDLDTLEGVIDLLACSKKIPARFKNHQLQGRLKGIEECHIESDLLLLYQRNKSELVLILIRVGSHAEVFSM
jgi:mRNA interferase YafQ